MRTCSLTSCLFLQLWKFLFRENVYFYREFNSFCCCFMQAIKVHVLVIAGKITKPMSAGNVFLPQYASYLHTYMKHQIIILLFKYLHTSSFNHYLISE